MLYAGNYRPLSVWTYALNYRLNTVLRLAPENIWSYRIVNILFHAGVAGAVYILAGEWERKVGGSPQLHLLGIRCMWKRLQVSLGELSVLSL